MKGNGPFVDRGGAGLDNIPVVFQTGIKEPMIKFFAQPFALEIRVNAGKMNISRVGTASFSLL